jgi:hypothetical protein
MQESRVKDFSGRGDQDVSGRGSVDAAPVAQDGQAQANAGTLRPGGGSWDAALRAVLGGQQAQPQEETEETEETEDTEETEEGKKMKTEDYIQVLFNGETLTEEFKAKAKTIFEAAVAERVAEIEQNIIEASAAVIREETEKAVTVGLENLTEAVDGYLTEVSKEWLKENQVEVERGLRTEIAENFISGLKELFENSYVEVPEEKVDLVDDLFEQNSKLEEVVNGALAENIQLRSALGAQLCVEQFVKVSNGLTDTEKERLATLSESIDFESPEQYGEKLNILKESYFGTNSSPITETLETPGTATKSVPEPIMEAYVNAISRQLKKK